MPDGLNGIATRQHASGLFSTVTPLGAGATILSKPFEVAGFANIVVSADSDQPISILLEEANTPDGPWTPVITMTSTVIGSLSRINQIFRPIGSFMRASVINGGGVQHILSALIYGIPS